MKRLLNESLEVFDDEECNFRIRTALQLCSAMQAELDDAKAELEVFEAAMAGNEELRETLRDIGLEVGGIAADPGIPTERGDPRIPGGK